MQAFSEKLKTVWASLKFLKRFNELGYPNAFMAKTLLSVHLSCNITHGTVSFDYFDYVAFIWYTCMHV